MVYQIRIKGHLDSQWADWFEGLTITLEENGDTLITGAMVDQAALFGLLAVADTLRVRIGAPVEQVNGKEIEKSLARLRAQLGDVMFELAWAKGATMTTEQAIALALS